MDVVTWFVSFKFYLICTYWPYMNFTCSSGSGYVWIMCRDSFLFPFPPSISRSTLPVFIIVAIIHFSSHLWHKVFTHVAIWYMCKKHLKSFYFSFLPAPHHIHPFVSWTLAVLGFCFVVVVVVFLTLAICIGSTSLPPIKPLFSSLVTLRLI